MKRSLFPTLLMILWIALPGISLSQQPLAKVKRVGGETIAGTVVFGDNNVAITDASGQAARIALAEIESLTLTPPPSVAAEAGMLPQGWESMSYGGDDVTGSAGQAGGVFAFSIHGEGGHFIYQQSLATGEIVVRVDELTEGSAAGIQVRGRRGSSKTAALQVDSTGVVKLTVHGDADAEGVELESKTVPGVVAPPCWLKLKRSARGVQGFYSQSGEQWQSLGEELKSQWWRDALSKDDDEEEEEEEDDDEELRILAGLFLESASPGEAHALLGDVRFQGMGLKAEYFEGRDFGKRVLTRAETSLLIEWEEEAPIPQLGPDDFSIRWTAELIPRLSGPHEFWVDGDDAAQLWIDGKVVTGNWPDNRQDERTLDLKAGQAYPMRVDYFEALDRAAVHVRMREPADADGEEKEDEGIPIEMLRYEISGDSLDTVAAPGGVILKDGTFIAGKLLVADAKAITILENASSQRSIDRALVARVVLNPTAQAKDEVESGRLGARMVRGDFFEGDFEGASGGNLVMSSIAFGQRRFPVSNEVAEIILAEPEAPVDHARFILRTVSGSRWRVTDEPVLSPQSITFKHPLLGAQSIPVNALVSLDREANREPAPVGATPTSFPEPYSTEKAPGSAQPAAEAAAGMTLPDGFAANVFASEPQVRQPVAMSFDAKGRLWVVECYTYAEASVNFAKDLRDRILIFTDTDGDGTADERKVFWDKGQKVLSVLPGNGGAYVLAAPQMLFIPDANGDDVPDGPPEVLLDGFDADKIRHTMVNGLKWGPDGWIYGRHGIQAWSQVGAPGTPDAQRTPVNCCIWRYHPLRKTFEVVCEGGTNSWGWDYDAEGEMFFINTVIGHFWHAIPGAFYKRMYGEHRRDHLYELLDQHADHVHWATGEAWNDASSGISDSTSAAGGGHAHTGLLIYQGGSFPNEWKGRALTINFLGRRLNAERLEATGSGFTARHLPDFAQMSDPWFRGIELVSGPDGAVYVADWSDTGECHDHDGVNRDTGRIYRIQHKGKDVGLAPDLSSQGQGEWVKLLASANAWHWRTALRLLQEAELEPGTITELVTTALDENGAPLVKLRAFWALADQPEAETVAERFQKEGNVAQRCWAVRWMLDHAAARPRLAQELTEWARNEKSPRVRLYMAGALQKIPLEQRGDLAREISQDPADDADHNLPLLIWYGIEELISARPESAPGLFATMKLKLDREFIARRLFEMEDAGSESLSRILTQCLAAEDEAGLVLALNGMTAAAQAMNSAPPLPDWQRVASHPYVTGHGERSLQVLNLGALMGEESPLTELVKRMHDKTLPAKERGESLERFFTLKPELLGAQAGELIEDPALVDALLPLLRGLPSKQSAPLLLARLPEASESERQQIIEVFVSRIEGARLLVTALEEKTIQTREVSALQARQILSLEDAALTERLEKVWGVLRPTREDLREKVSEWTAKMTIETLSKADLDNGREVFSRACAACHKMFDEGGVLGPELTGSDRGNLQYLLENIIDPNAVVPVDAQAVVVTLTDGQVFSGVGGARRGDAVTLRTPTDTFSWPAAQVREVRPLGASLMPEGLLDALSAEEARDLLGWLMRGQPGRSQTATERRYPSTDFVVDVSKPPYGAKGDGIADDTEALQRAIGENTGRHRLLYFPNGTYLVSRTLKWPKRWKEHDNWGMTFLCGQSRDHSVIRLKDATFTDAADPQAIMWCGGFGSADWFHNYVENLTFDVGDDNPGATALQFYSNNSGAVRDCRFIAGEGSGATGLDLGHRDMNGPLLVRNCDVIGFNRGISTGASVNSQTFEHITLRGQREIGFHNEGQTISIRGLTSTNAVPSVGTYGTFLLVDAKLEGIGAAAQAPAIVNYNGGRIFLRDIATTGYGRALADVTTPDFAAAFRISGADKPGSLGPEIREYVSHAPTRPFPSPETSLRLPVKETPEAVWDDPETWANVDQFGADPTGQQDSAAAIQEAIDSGATTIFLPGSYNLRSTVTIRGKVRRIVGLGGMINYGKGLDPDLRLSDGESSVVIIEHFANVHGGLEIDTNRTLVMRSVMDCNVTSTAAAEGGDVFFEDVGTHGLNLRRQHLWARQLNIENEGTHLRNTASDVWVLGYKTERGGTLLETRAGGRSELLGGFSYTTTAGKLAPMLVNDGSSVFTFFGEVCYSGDPFETLIRETRDGETRTVPREAGSTAPYSGRAP